MKKILVIVLLGFVLPFSINAQFVANPTQAQIDSLARMDASGNLKGAPINTWATPALQNILSPQRTLTTSLAAGLLTEAVSTDSVVVFDATTKSYKKKVVSSFGGTLTSQSLTATGTATAWNSVVTVGNASANVTTLPVITANDIGKTITIKNVNNGINTQSPPAGAVMVGGLSLKNNESVTFVAYDLTTIQAVSDKLNAVTSSVQNITATGNITAWNSKVYVDATAGNIILTLPTTVGQDGTDISIIRTDATTNTVTLAPFAGQTLSLLSSGNEIYQSKGALTVTASGTVATQKSNIGTAPVIGDYSGVVQFSAGTGTNLTTVTSTNTTTSGTLLTTTSRVALTGATVSGGMTVNAANGTIAISKAGTYTVNIVMNIQSAGANGQWGQLVKNNATIISNASAYSQAASAGMQIVFNYTGLFAVGDLIDVRLSASSAGTIGITGYSYSVVQESGFLHVIGQATNSQTIFNGAYVSATVGNIANTGGATFTVPVTGQYKFDLNGGGYSGTTGLRTGTYQIRQGTTVLYTATVNHLVNLVSTHLPFPPQIIFANLQSGVTYNVIWNVGNFTSDANDYFLVTATQVGASATSSFANLVPIEANGNTVQVDMTKQVGIGTQNPLAKIHSVNTVANSTQGAFTNTADLTEGTSISSNGTVAEIKMNNAGSANWTISNDGAFKINNTSASASPYTAGTNVLTALVSGNVGIGTASPDAPFTIASSTTIPSAPTSLNGLKFFFNTVLGEGSIHSTNSIGTNYLTFYTSTGGSSGEKMRIAGNGNVGIGTTTPTDKLTIQGGAISFNNPTNLLPYVGIDYDQTLDGLRFRSNVASAALNTTNMFMSRITGNFGIATSNPLSTLDNAGSLGLNRTTSAAAAYTILATDLVVNLSLAGAQTVTLPAAASFNRRILKITNPTATAKTLGTAYTTIFGFTNTVIQANSWVEIQSDGALWQEVSASENAYTISWTGASGGSLGGVTWSSNNADPLILTSNLAATGYVAASVTNTAVGIAFDSWSTVAASGAGAELLRGRSWNGITTGNIGLVSPAYCHKSHGVLVANSRTFEISSYSYNGTHQTKIKIIR